MTVHYANPADIDQGLFLANFNDRSAQSTDHAALPRLLVKVLT